MPSQACNPTTRYCIFPLDTTSPWTQNSRNFSVPFLVQEARAEKVARRFAGSTFAFTLNASREAWKPVSENRGRNVQYLPGWTVQCINPECLARGHWLRAAASGGELCSNCNAPLHNVPPPLGPRLRLRPRSLGSYRPPGRSPGRPRSPPQPSRMGPLVLAKPGRAVPAEFSFPDFTFGSPQWW